MRRFGETLTIMTVFLGTVAGTASGQETPIVREHSLLRGTWSLVSLEDNGNILGPDVIREKLIADGRITIGDRLCQFTGALDGKTHTYAYRLEVDREPKGIELIDESDGVLRGIYAFLGDQLVICVHRGDEPRVSSELAAPAGSGDMLMTLQIVTAEVLAKEAKAKEEAEAERLHERRTALARDSERVHLASQTRAVEPSPAQEAAAASQPPPPSSLSQPAQPMVMQTVPASIAVTTESAAPPKPVNPRNLAISKMLVGTWTYNDSRGSVVSRFNDNGTFKTTRRWNSASDQFVSGMTTSVGTWTYADGNVTSRISQSTDSKLTGQVITNRVHAIGEESFTLIDTLGRILHETRVR